MLLSGAGQWCWGVGLFLLRPLGMAAGGLATLATPVSGGGPLPCWSPPAVVSIT